MNPVLHLLGARGEALVYTKDIWSMPVSEACACLIGLGLWLGSRKQMLGDDVSAAAPSVQAG